MAKGRRLFDCAVQKENREMRSADTVLAVIHDRGQRGLPLERVFHLLYNRDLYLRAYAKLYPNKGALTRGTTPETVDGMSLAKIDRVIDDLRQRRFRWTPVRRTYIPKRNGKGRPLGVTTWRDKLVQEVIRSLLEAYYEPQFSPSSQGFRPGRGCHTALTTIQQTWTGTRWFIEGDLAQYFDTISHDKLLEILSEQIHDPRFLRLIRELLKAGYLENWKFHQTLSGTPQGAILSPLLSNIFLDRFDQYVEQTLIPTWTRGSHRHRNPAYVRVAKTIRRAKRRGQKTAVKAGYKQLRQLSSVDPHDPSYRRLRYQRYADDWLIGFAGTKAEAEEIKRQITEWLRTHLHLTLSDEKTLITHATTGEARFLGYGIVTQQSNTKIGFGRRCINGSIGLRVPRGVAERSCRPYLQAGKTRHRTDILEESDFSIVTRYQQEYRGLVNYYSLATNIYAFNKLHWVMEQSLVKTLARKHKCRMSVIRAKYKTTVRTPEGKRLVCLQVRVDRAGKRPLIAQFGGISLTRQPHAILNDTPYVYRSVRSEILKRLLANTCELCGSDEAIEVHHIRKLADLACRNGRDQPPWVKRMRALRRKTLVVCQTCHHNIHAGRPTVQRQME
jgi:group II intron reverse transcriptase/maturase